MDYIDPAVAVDQPGLRLVLTSGVPGPWGEAAKGIFFVKGIDYTAVRQSAGEEDPTLIGWTRQGGAPAAMYENERPRTDWAEILLLAERLAPQPPLVPSDPEQRALMFGIAHEICGEDGFGWSRRLLIFDPIMRDQPPVDSSNVLGWKYGYSPESADRAVGRIRDILRLLADRLHAQRAAGSGFLVGSQLSAADIYWATFAAMLVPLPPEQCPMPEWMRPMYDLRNHQAGIDFDPILLGHRDFIYREYLSLPMEF